MSKELKVAAVQTSLYPKDEERAIREAISLTRSATKKSARLVCFPEHWLIDKVLHPEDNEVYDIFCDLAKELDVYINLGGIFESISEDKITKDSTSFLSPTISPDGRIISKQKKVHLFRRETSLASGGSSFNTFDIDDVKVGVMVCHDVVFPESARTLVLKGAELLLNPSLIPSLGYEPWRIYLKARALENRVSIIAPNPYLYPRIPGKSMILGLEYEKKQGIMRVEELAKSQFKGSGVIISKIFFDDKIEALRDERLSERRPDAYSSRRSLRINKSSSAAKL